MRYFPLELLLFSLLCRHHCPTLPSFAVKINLSVSLFCLFFNFVMKMAVKIVQLLSLI